MTMIEQDPRDWRNKRLGPKELFIFFREQYNFTFGTGKDKERIGGPNIPIRIIKRLRWGSIGPLDGWLKFLQNRGKTPDGDYEKFAPLAACLGLVKEVWGGPKEVKPYHLIKEFYVTSEGRVAQEGDKRRMRPKMWSSALEQWLNWVLKNKYLPSLSELLGLLLGDATHSLDSKVGKERWAARGIKFGLVAVGGMGLTYLIPTGMDVTQLVKSGIIILSGGVGLLGGGVVGAIKGKRYIPVGTLAGMTTGGLLGNEATKHLPNEIDIPLDGYPQLVLTAIAMLGINKLLTRWVPISNFFGGIWEEKKRKVIDGYAELGKEIRYLIPPIASLFGLRRIREWITEKGFLPQKYLLPSIIEVLKPKLNDIDNDNTIIKAISDTNFADEKNISPKVFNLIIKEYSYSAALLIMALIEFFRRKKIDLPKPNELDKLLTETGRERLEAIKAFSETDPLLALAIALPSIVRTYPELGKLRIEELSKAKWPGGYYDAKLYGERGNLGNSGGLLPLQRCWFRELAAILAKSSYLGNVFQLGGQTESYRGLKHPITEIVFPPLVVEALLVSAAWAADFNRSGESGIVKHSLKAFVIDFKNNRQFSIIDLCILISSVNFYIKMAEFYQKIYPESEETFGKAISNLQTFRREVIRVVINNYFANSQDIISGKVPTEETMRLSFLLYWIDKECPEEFKGVVSTLESLYSGSGVQGEKTSKSPALIWTLGTLLEYVKDEDIRKAAINLLRQICSDIINTDLMLSGSSSWGEEGGRERFKNQDWVTNVLYFFETLISILSNHAKDRGTTEKEIFQALRDLLKNYENSAFSLGMNIKGGKRLEREFVEEVLFSVSNVINHFDPRSQGNQPSHQEELKALIKNIRKILAKADDKVISGNPQIILST